MDVHVQSSKTIVRLRGICKVLDAWNSTGRMALETMDEFLFAGSINALGFDDFIVGFRQPE